MANSVSIASVSLESLSLNDAKTREERSLEILKSGEGSDVTFLIGQAKTPIRAHKLILRIYSRLFERIFKNTPSPTYDLPNVEPRVFNPLLELIYSGTCEAPTSPDDALLFKKFEATLQLAPRSPVVKLHKFTEDDITKTTALTIYQHAFLNNDLELQKAARIEICKFAYELIENEAFLAMKEECLEKLIGLDDFSVLNEMQLFDALLRWADSECRRCGTLTSPKYCRSALEKLIPLIRFPLMEPVEFSLKVFPKGILTTEEVLWVHSYFNVPKSQRNLFPQNGPFSYKPRECFKKPALMDQLQKAVTNSPRIFMEFGTEGGESLGFAILQLRGEVAPNLSENFRALCTGEKGFGYKGTKLHQSSAPTGVKGGGMLDSGVEFDVEEDKLVEDRSTPVLPGELIMAWPYRQKTTSKFLLATDKSHYDDVCSYTVFGYVLSGMDVLLGIGKLLAKEATVDKVLIVDCGQL